VQFSRSCVATESGVTATGPAGPDNGTGRYPTVLDRESDGGHFNHESGEPLGRVEPSLTDQVRRRL